MLTPLEHPKREKMNAKEEDEEDQYEEEEGKKGEEPLSHLNLIWYEEEFNDDNDDDIMEEACLGNDYNFHSKGSLKMNYSPYTLNTNTKNMLLKLLPPNRHQLKNILKRRRRRKERRKNKLFLVNPPSFWT